LAEITRGMAVREIQQRLTLYGLTEHCTTIEDDIIGFINIGINIAFVNGGYKLIDRINSFIIPIINELEKSDLLEDKDRIREKLDVLPHEYLSLIDLSFDHMQNRLFEMKVIELLRRECGYIGMHLGSCSKPDGIIYTDSLENENYGVIIDTKAYSNGYNLPITQADEMIRYINENQARDVQINPNKWWENFGQNIGVYYYLFISGKFIGNINEKLDRIALRSGTNGAAIAIHTLLLLANEIKSTRLDLSEIESIFINSEYRIEL
jgi:hypothetical protein